MSDYDHWDTINEVKDIMNVLIEKLNEGLEKGISIEFNISQQDIPTARILKKGEVAPKEYSLTGFKADLTQSIVNPAPNG